MVFVYTLINTMHINIINFSNVILICYYKRFEKYAR